MKAYSSAAAAAAAASSSEEGRGLKAPQASFHGSLHSVRKPLSKPWKKPIAPFPPTPPKVYTVDPINFRDLVQQLTGAPQFMSQSHNQTSTSQFQFQAQQQRLQRVAPPSLHVAAPPFSRTEVSAPLHLVSGLDHTTSQNQNFSDTAMFTSNSLGLTLSPSSFNWFTFPILSPGTLASLEQSTVP